MEFKMFAKRRFLALFLLGLFFSTPALAQFDMQLIATMQGARDTLRFGFSLAGVGDINQDGFEDLAVGQHGSNTFIYFGSKNFDTTADLSFPFFAWHIGHGDINGDGISDLLLTPMGTIYIYYGGTNFDAIPDDSVVNNASYFGWNFACGDINKDGYDDLVVWGADTKVFVYLGGAKISTQPIYILQGPPFYFGFNGLAIGDVNGDGYEDLAVSTTPPSPQPDSTYIYFGGMQLDTIPRFKLKGGGVLLGDINGDGYEDIITSNGTYFGDTVIDSVVDVGIASGGCSPPKCTAVGEFNKDIYEDVLGGITTVGGGEAWIYLGGNPPDNVQDWHHSDYEVGDYGQQVGAADINGDGVDEAIVGDPGWWWNNPSYPPGRVYVYDNPYTIVEEEQNSLPHNFALYQNYPNPFNSTTIIPYGLNAQGSMLKGPSHITLKIYNVMGQLVKTLVDKEKLPGSYQVIWDGKDEQGEVVGSGIYFYRLQAGNFTNTAKMSLLK
jgi:hypothetical protein